MTADIAGLEAELKAATEAFRQAKEQTRQARKVEARRKLEMDEVNALLVRALYKRIPFKKRLPRLTSGRPGNDMTQIYREMHHRMIYLELLARKAETGKPVINHTGPDLAGELAAELSLSEATIRKSWRIGKTLDGIKII